MPASEVAMLGWHVCTREVRAGLLSELPGASQPPCCFLRWGLPGRAAHVPRHLWCQRTHCQPPSEGAVPGTARGLEPGGGIVKPAHGSGMVGAVPRLGARGTQGMAFSNATSCLCIVG